MAGIDDIEENDFEDELGIFKDRRKYTKEEQIYGIWAENDESENYNKLNRKRSGISKKVKQVKIINDEKEEKFGDWEKHTTGYGSKMLEKMGFVQGKGLGKSGSGIVEPIKAQPRQGRGTIGAYGNEKQSSTPKVDIVKEVSPEFIPSWKKSVKSKKYIKKSFDDLIIETNHNENIKIIDMTSSDTKISYGYDSLKFTQKTTSNFDIPELRHNLSTLVKLNENHVKSNLKRMSIKKDLLENLKTQRENCKESMNLIERENDKLKNLINILNNINLACSAETDNFKKIYLFLTSIEIIDIEYMNEFKIDKLIHTVIYPILDTIFRHDSLYTNPKNHIKILKLYESVIRNIYKNEEIYIIGYSKDIYDNTIKDTLIPNFIEFLKNYQMSQYQKILTFWEEWKNILNHDIICIIRKIIYDFLHTFLEKCQSTNWSDYDFLLYYKVIINEEDIQNMYKILVKKLINTYQSWSPPTNDNDTLNNSLIWFHNILTSEQIKSVIHRILVPKLSNYLDTNLIINPQNQSLEPLMNVFSWHHLIDSRTMSLLIAKSFSSKWLNVLNLWLNSNPNYSDVKLWYNGWKSLFQKYIHERPIQSIFNQALLMLEQSINNLPIQPVSEFCPSLYNDNNQENEHKVKSHHISLTFKEVLESQANQHSILFTPTSKKRPDGKTIYMFGSSSIYIDREVIFLQNDNHWKPISIDELLSLST